MCNANIIQIPTFSGNAAAYLYYKFQEVPECCSLVITAPGNINFVLQTDRAAALISVLQEGDCITKSIRNPSSLLKLSGENKFVIQINRVAAPISVLQEGSCITKLVKDPI